MLLQQYVTDEANENEVIISIKLNELIQAILSKKKTTYSRLKVKFE